MSVVLDKIDSKNIIVTVAVVDKFGGLNDNKDFTHLWFKKRGGKRGDDQAGENKMRMNNEDE